MKIDFYGDRNNYELRHNNVFLYYESFEKYLVSHGQICNAKIMIFLIHDLNIPIGYFLPQGKITKVSSKVMSGLLDMRCTF